MARGSDDVAVVRSGRWTWRVRSEFKDKAAGIEKRIASARSRPGARAVKETGGRRTIWTMPLQKGGGRAAFVKHYSKPRFTKQLKHLVRNSRTRQEWEMGVRLEALGLPVARHLAMGERRVAGLLLEDYLVQENLEGYRDFDQWFTENFDAGTEGHAARRAFIEAFADLIRLMHDQGVLQRDFKPDSIMVGPRGDMRLVDLERALIKRRALSRSERIANLAKIDQTFGFIGSAADRLRFLRRYFRNAGLAADELHKTAAGIALLSEINFRKRAREDRIWAETKNSSYRQYRIRGCLVSSYLTLHREFLEAAVACMERSRTDGLVCSWEPQTPGLSFRLKGVWCDARTALGHSPYLYSRRVPFVPARAAIRPSSGPWGLLLCEDPPLITWKKGAEQAGERGEAVEFASDLGRVLRILHRMGITWRQYRPDTMLYDPGREDLLMRFYVSRLDQLILDRSPGPEESRRILETVAGLLGLSPAAAAAMRDSYRRCRLRWFKAPERW
ncbi:MAG TPA: lipopolysaccharide kinase InaA family protein [bacterium]|nr:lipopolysaccharide kinase InaA family protein [bacterium]